MGDSITLTRETAQTLLGVCASLPSLPKAADKVAVGKAQLELERALGKEPDASARITELT